MNKTRNKRGKRGPAQGKQDREARGEKKGTPFKREREKECEEYKRRAKMFKYLLYASLLATLQAGGCSLGT